MYEYNIVLSFGNFLSIKRFVMHIIRFIRAILSTRVSRVSRAAIDKK